MTGDDRTASVTATGARYDAVIPWLAALEASGASLTSVQLLSYFTGYEEHKDLRAEAERRWGKEFSLRRYHDTVLSFGSPPTKYARALMFGEPVTPR